MTPPPVMSMTVAEAQEFFGVLGALTDECRLKITETGWFVKVVDPANVAMVVIDYPFSVLPAKPIIVDDSVPTEVGLVKIDQILEKLKIHEKYSPEQSVKFSYSYTDGFYKISPTQHQVVLTMRIGSITETIDIPYITEFRRTTQRPNIDFSAGATVHVRTQQFRMILARAGFLNDYIEIGIEHGDDENQFYVRAYGDTEVMDVKASDHSYLIQGIGGTMSTKSRHPLNYMDDMVTAIKDQVITMQLGDGYPVVIKFTVCGKGTGEYILAPRMDSK